MNTFAVWLLLAGELLKGPNLATPVYPPLAFHGGNIVAVIDPGKREDDRVTILHSEPPYVEIVQSALKRWRFTTSESHLVIVNFRDWDIRYRGAGEGGIEFVAPQQAIQWSSEDRSLPLPSLIVDPLYPDVYPDKLFVIADGSIVLHLVIDCEGHVSRCKLIRGVREDFDQAAIEAVRQWLFLPALSRDGTAVQSEAYAVYVYRPLPQNRAND